MQTENKNKRESPPATVQFSERLRQVMSVKKIYQKDVIAGTGANKSMVSAWMNGHQKAGPKNNRILADFFGCDPEWLASGKGEPFPESFMLDHQQLPLDPTLEDHKRGLSLERHKEIGVEMYLIEQQLLHLLGEFGAAYPREGLLARPTNCLQQTIDVISKTRDLAEENLFKDFPQKADVHIYYPGNLLKRDICHEYLATVAKEISELTNKIKKATSKNNTISENNNHKKRKTA